MFGVSMIRAEAQSLVLAAQTKSKIRILRNLKFFNYIGTVEPEHICITVVKLRKIQLYRYKYNLLQRGIYSAM